MSDGRKSSEAKRQAWETRREKYGPNGHGAHRPTLRRPKNRRSTGTITETAWWAIVGENGLYSGTAGRQCDAIAQHVHDLDGVSRFCAGRSLSEEQKAAWARARARGDRVVRVSITYKVQP